MSEEKKISPWKQTSIAAMTSYIDAGSIVAGAAGLALWQSYLGLTGFMVGLVTAFSSNAFGAAIGALIGGPLCDKYGRKFVYTYDLLVYIIGMLMIVFASSHSVAATPYAIEMFGQSIQIIGGTFDYGFYMLFCGYIIVGIAVGADVVASWTLIAEQAPAENRARHCGAAQFAWAIGPAVVLLMSALLGWGVHSNQESLLKFFNKTDEVANILNADTASAEFKKSFEEAKKAAKAESEATADQKAAATKVADEKCQIAAEKVAAARAAENSLAADYKLDAPKEAGIVTVGERQIDAGLVVLQGDGPYRALHFELLGNRLVFGHLIIIAFITWYLRLGMPESETWKAAKAKERELIASGEIKNYGMRALLSWVNLKTVLFLCGVYVVWNWAAGTMGFLLPYIYQSVGGISNAMSCGLVVILFGVSAVATVCIFMLFGDRVSRRLIYSVVAALFVVAWGLFLIPSQYMSIWIFVLISILMGINNGSGQQAFYQLWCSELFPARYRASAQGFTFFAARITVGVWTFCVPIIIDNIGFSLAAQIMVGFALFSMFVGMIFAPNTSGKTLEQIEQERYGNGLK